MAKMVLTNGYLLINAVNLSAWVKEMSLDYSADLKDSETMGDTTHEKTGGLKDWTLTATMLNDYAAGGPDATLFPLVGTSVAIEARADAGARSVTNPGYTGNAVVESYNPVAGSVGDMAACQVTLRCNGALSRQTA